ncbi:MAG: GerMN domain-containing protein [Elusimicrobiota bacterium]
MIKKILKITLTCLIVLTIGAIVFIKLKNTFLPETKIESGAVEEAEYWVREHSPTYNFDGMELELKKSSKVEPGIYKVIFNFKSRQAGYGDRTGEILAQAVTPHEIAVTVKKSSQEEGWKVTRAVTDNSFDELNEKVIDKKSEKENREIDIFFIRVKDGQEELASVSRDVAPGDNIEKSALKALLAGPTEEEKEEGYLTAINDGVKILSFTIEDKKARVSFDKSIEKNVAGSATVTAIRNQIESTLTQFDSINYVEIQVEGKTDDILQP